MKILSNLKIITNGYNERRAKDFRQILNFTNNSGIILNYPDLKYNNISFDIIKNDLFEKDTYFYNKYNIKIDELIRGNY